jgi:hypothetical protein
MKVGDPIWIFDNNRRVYPPTTRKNRNFGSSPIWREHWHRQIVVSETRLSWVTNFGKKVPKRGRDMGAVAFSEREIDERCYIHEHGRQIGNLVREIEDYTTLRAIAELIDYKP